MIFFLLLAFCQLCQLGSRSHRGGGSLMSLSVLLCVPQTAVQRKQWRVPCKLMCPLPPRGFHFAMQPYGRAPPLSNPSLVSASNPGGPHFCVFSFSLSVCLSLAHLSLPLTFFFFFASSFGILRVSLLNSFCLPSHSLQHAKGWNIVF